MRAKEFLRALTDMIDSIQDDDEPKKAPPVIVNVNGQGATQGAGSAAQTKTALDRNVFVPPLQTKIELMKKSVGQQDKNAAMFGSEDDGPFE